MTQVLIDAMRAQAAEVGLGWDMVQAADAAPPGSRDAAGLSVLVQRSLPAVDAAIEAARRGSRPKVTRPVLLTEIAPLARYGHLTMLQPVGRPRRPAARRPSGCSSRNWPEARAPSSTNGPCRWPHPGSTSASTPSGSTPTADVPAAEGAS